MKHKVLKIMVAIALIIAITMSDFIVVGTGVITYALESISDNKTNHDNVKFQAYFKTEEEKEKSLTAAINSNKIKLCMEIKVLEDGYFDGQISISDSNFKIKEQTSENKKVNKIEGNTIVLNRIAAGETAEIEVEVEPIRAEEYVISTLNQESKVNLTGTYKDATEEPNEITATKGVALNLTLPSEINVEATSKIITNRVYKIQENEVADNKKIVQVEIENRIENDVYPIKTTKYEIDVLENAEIVEVISKGTEATNGEGQRKLAESEYTYNEETRKLEIEIENQEENGKISWTEGKTDRIIVTYMLDDEEETIGKEIHTKITTTFYGETEKQVETEPELVAKIEKEADGLIKTKIENEEGYIYKGKIYSKEEREYKTTTNIEVNYGGLAENVVIDQETAYGTEVENEEKAANIEYKTTTLEKAEFDKVLGTEETAKLKIKDQNGNAIKEITAADFDTTGKAQVTYAAGVKGIKIELSKPVEAGIIRLNHVKTIKEESYEKAELKTITTLVEKAKTTYSAPENNTAEYTYERKTSLLETKTQVDFQVEPRALSTAVTNEQVKMAITLRTDSEEFDLFEAPVLKIKLPNSVKTIKNLKINRNCLESNNLDIDESNFKYNIETKEITIGLTGKQTAYTGTNNQAYIEMLADIEIEEATPNQADKIVLTYTNQNAVTYVNEGKTEVGINIVGYSGVIGYNKITNYNVKGSTQAANEEKIGTAKMNVEQKEANFEIVVVNNTGEKIENVNIIGNLPVQGQIKVGEKQITNTIAATLKAGINTNGVGTVYYTSNANATANLAEAANGWNTNLAEVTNPVLYMIVVGNMEAATNYKASYTMVIPANLQYDQQMKTTYNVSYVAENQTKTVQVGTVGLETGKVLMKLEATLSGEELASGAKVQTGEVIKYKATVTNNGGNDVRNIVVKVPIPEGTVYVTPMEDFEYAEMKLYYDEHKEQTEYETTIEILKAGETKEIEYEVRVKTEAEEGQTIENQVTATYGDGIELRTNRINNIIQKGSLRVTVKRRSDTTNVKLIPAESVQYYVIVENISNTEIKDIDLQLNIPEGLTYSSTEAIKDAGSEINERNIKIEKIASGDYNIYKVFCTVETIEEISRNVKITAIAKHGEKTYKSNGYEETIYGLDLNMEMTATHEGEYLEAGDIIEYQIKIENKSAIFTDAYTIETEIPKQLTIKRIEQNGKALEITDDNYFNSSLSIEANSTIVIRITAAVDYDPTRFDVQKLLTSAKLAYLGIEKITTSPIIHYLDSIIEEEEKEPVGTEKPTVPEQPTNPVLPEVPTDPVDPNKPIEPIEPIEPINPEKPTEPPVTPEQPVVPEEPVKNKYNISGKAWIDQDKDGEMNNKDTVIKGIRVKLLNLETNTFERNEEKNKELVAITGNDGDYLFENVEEGKYIVVFEYDISLYKPTIYKKDGIEESKNSNVISKTLTINNEEKEYAITDEINLNGNAANLNMGLVFTKQFDIELDKYISKIIVQTAKETKTYEYENKEFAKIEIHKKQMVGATIIVQYTMKAKNIGDVDAYVKTLVDYMPNEFKFSSELNKDWYEVGGELFTNSLANTAIKPGETKEINLTLTKTLSEGNAELINNMAEIHEAYNIYGIADINSTEANNNKDENDLGSADLIISIQTGNAINYISLVIAMLAIIGVGVYIINRKVLKIRF